MIGAVEPKAGDVPSVSNTGVVGFRCPPDKSLDDGVGRQSGEIEEVQRSQLAVVLPDVAEITSARGIRQDPSYHGGRPGAAFFLIVHEEEQLVLDNGTAHIPPELMDQNPLLLDAGGVVEEVGSVEGVVSMIVEKLPVELITA